jgi:hypothetical protein
MLQEDGQLDLGADGERGIRDQEGTLQARVFGGSLELAVAIFFPNPQENWLPHREPWVLPVL